MKIQEVLDLVVAKMTAVHPTRRIYLTWRFKWDLKNTATLVIVDAPKSATTFKGNRNKWRRV